MFVKKTLRWCKFLACNTKQNLTTENSKLFAKDKRLQQKMSCFLALDSWIESRGRCRSGTPQDVTRYAVTAEEYKRMNR
jgi:hypothetical protein